mmetsp:Transcript_32997/g.32698  ORF Transcript_32997/g.32698 Transcript_32997/m.32698 type:complete len:393 (-) Transcript_32997:230-1408(-)
MDQFNINSLSTPHLISRTPRIVKSQYALQATSPQFSSTSKLPYETKNFEIYPISDSTRVSSSARTKKPIKFPSSPGSQTPKSNYSSNSTGRTLSSSASLQSLQNKNIISSSRSEIQPKQSLSRVNSASTKNLTPKASRTPTNRSTRNKMSKSVSASKIYQPSIVKEKQLNSPRAAEQRKESEFSQLITQVKSPEMSKIAKSTEDLKEISDAVYREHLFQTFQALKFVKMLPAIDPYQIQAKRVNLPKKPGYLNKKTIVFDLDETLVHCCEGQENSKPDVILPITFPTGEVINAGINIRPYAREVLKEASAEFEVIIFTASQKCYADVVIDFLDPTGEFVHHRLFRENCINVQGVFIKDLRILANRRIQDIVIVDNAAYSFGYQLDNGVPIIS